MSRLHFDRFVFEVDSGELRAGAHTLALQPQAAKLLEALARQSGRVVTRERLGGVLWGDEHHVDRELGINQCVRQVRKALGDDARAPRFVETLPRRGYRFLPPVRDEGAVPPSMTPRGPRSTADRPPGRGLALLAALLLVLVPAGLWRRVRS